MERKSFLLGIFGFLFWANFLTWIAVFEVSRLPYLKVVFFDVGQGDAIFVESPQGHQILIDGGPDSRILEKLPKEMPFYDRSLDLLILTHPERDHMAGLIEVLKKYKVDYILWTGVLRDTPDFQEWANTLSSIKIGGGKAQIKIARAGQKIIASKAVFDILYPFENLEGKEFKNSNDTSIVLKLSFNNSKFLFTGDIYKSGEQELIEKGSDFDIDVLKIAHHGSKTSSSEEFLERTSPEIAVIQLGKNPYGHPHQEVLERLEKYGIEVLRTDEKGDIEMISDGEYLKILNPKFEILNNI